VLVSALFAVSLFAGLVSAGKDGDVVERVEDDGENATACIAKWSVLVYLMADNGLDDYAEIDLEELRTGGSSTDVNVLILVDRLYEPAYLLAVEGHELVTLESIGEINMGDPATLSCFVGYCDTNFPAERMLLSFWDHGSGTYGVGSDETMEDGSPGDDWLSHQEMISALEGYHIDIIATDECSVGQMEVLYEYAAKGLSVDYVVACENGIGWRGFSYDDILLRLNDDPYMGAEELSLIIVEEFTDEFSVPSYECEILSVQAVFNMSKIEALGQAVLKLADTLAADIDSYSRVICKARLASLMPWGATLYAFADMTTFVGALMNSLGENDPAAAACAEVLAVYDECMIGMGVTKNSEKFGYEGMGIRFPASYAMYTTDSGSYAAATYEPYMTFEFPNAGWWAFLETYWGVA